MDMAHVAEMPAIKQGMNQDIIHQCFSPIKMRSIAQFE
jgi:hypothetical protein